MMLPRPDPVSLDALQPILDTALDAVVVTCRDGIVLAWNAIAERTFGWATHEALGRQLAELIIPPQHREAHLRGMRRYLETGVARILNRRIEISALRKDGTEIPVELSITQAGLSEDSLFIGFLRDISPRRDTEELVRRQAHEARLLFEITRLAADTESFDEALNAVLKAICDLTDWSVGHALVALPGQKELVSTSVWYEELPGAAAGLQEATRALRFTSGVGLPGLILQTREPVWMADADAHSQFARKGIGFSAAFGFPVMSEGEVMAVLEFFSRSTVQPDDDLMLTVRTLGEQVGRILERKRTEGRQRLLINELNHRVKNTLAIVQSVAAQTFKEESDAARATFDGRLAALAGAYDVLSAQNWQSASLQEVINKTGLGCGADERRVRIEGPDVRLEAATAASLSLALHELCTNAIKYGALSNDDGKVTVSWTISELESSRRLHLRWEEEGGPPVRPPEKRGFGSRMVERALASAMQARVRLEFAPAGVVCVLDAPIR